MSGEIIVNLSKPVMAHGEEVDRLTLRAPTSEDVMQIGLPTLLVPGADGESVGVEVRTPVVGKYISRLAGVPLSTVKALPFCDFEKCIGAVMGFFNNGDGGEA